MRTFTVCFLVLLFERIANHYGWPNLEPTVFNTLLLILMLTGVVLAVWQDMKELL